VFICGSNRICLVQPTDLEIPALRTLAGSKAIAAILLISAAVFGSLIWLLYVRRASGTTSGVIAALPALNATMNGLSATFLVLAYRAVRRRRYATHIRFIFAALAASAVFLAGYLTYLAYHGDTKFLGQGPIRPIYFFILISHIVLSAVAVPMILTSLYLALAGRFPTHRRVSRYTFPVWLYVSVTAVLILTLIKAFHPG